MPNRQYLQRNRGMRRGKEYLLQSDLNHNQGESSQWVEKIYDTQ